MKLTFRLYGLLSVLGMALFCVTRPVGAAPAETPAAFAWKDAGIGSPVPGGKHTWDKGILTVTGAGAGLNVKGNDQVQYVCISRQAGDFEVVARLTAFTGDADSLAGIMARADDAANGNMAAVYFRTKNHSINLMSRIPGNTPDASRVFSSGVQLAIPQPAQVQPAPVPDNPPAPEMKPEPPAPRLPLWMRLVRIGKNMAAYKSRDGKLWTMMSNNSGAPVALNGPITVGFFVARPGDQMVTATFDNIQIGPAKMRYKSSWVGNTFGCRNDDSHVSNALSALWVAPDGTCYASSYWDEAGQPVTSYKDGKVLRPLPIGTTQAAEGGITGDDKFIYVAYVDRIIKLDPAAPNMNPLPIVLSVDMLDKKTGHVATSGLASTGKELFVSDARDNLVRVVTLNPVNQYEKPAGPNDGIILAPAPVEVPAGDPRYAPQLVYQSARVGEGFRYTIPGMTPGAVYTIRGHFADYVAKRPANADPRNFTRNVGNVTVKVAEQAGGALKALVVDFPSYKADDQGNVIVHSGSYGGPGLCGLEVLDAAGKRLFAINCGGPAVGDFKGECEELVDRDFPFDRPGPMVADKRGNLWIIQRATDFPMRSDLTPKYPAAVKCYTPDGKFTGREITDVVNPRGLGYDAAKDELLVGENGPDLNVRIYANLATKPALARTFGAKGGIYAGEHPGLVNDPAAGGYARFAGISGVGVDAKGNLYVGGGFQGTDLRMFTPDGKFGWMVNSLMFCNTYDVDPASDGMDIYGPYNHLKLDLTKTEPGTEQKYVGYNWDLRNYGDPINQGGSQSIIRRLGPDKRLVMFTSGQGNIGDINIFRYDGEIAIPAGGTREGGSVLWIDANGNGKMEDDEKTKMSPAISWITSLVVDTKGDIWATVSSTGGSYARHFFFKGFTEKGVPLYSAVKDDGYVDVPYPEEGAKTSAWAMASRMDYDADRDIMVAFYPAVARTGEKDKTAPQYFLARYDNWSKGNRTPVWKVKAFRPETDPDYFMYETNLYPYSGYMGMQVAGDYVFFAYLFGEIHVFDLKTGKIAEIFAMGPEVNGQSAWEDAAMGLRAFKRKNGEYLIFDENSGWGGKNNFIRWKP